MVPDGALLKNWAAGHDIARIAGNMDKDCCIAESRTE
jgi:hypothetical protein